MTKETFAKDEVLLDSIFFRLIQISENAAKLSNELKESNSDIPWYAIRGLRNRIVHDYGEIDYTIILNTVKKTYPSCIH